MNKHHNLWISIIAVSTLVFIVTLLSITGTRAAQELQGAPSTDGDLDMTFGSGGIASTPFYLPAQSIGYASVLQGDGKLLVGGSSGDAVDSELNNFSIARYNTDGTPDNSFGRGGTIETDFAYQEDRIEGLAVQSDGKIIAAGFARMNCCSGYEDFALARYNTNGSLDTSFSGDGKVNTDIGGAGDIVYDVKVQSDGKIVVAGTANDHFTLARYNSDGSLDTSFGNGGIATAVMGSQDLALSLSIQSDGKLVVAGDVFLSSNPSDLGVARFNPDGLPDNTFSGDGKLLTDINGGYDAANGVAVQPVDGRIVVVGSSEDSGNTTESAVVVRYNTDGTLDTSFDGDGIVTTDLGGYSSFSSVAIQSNNMIVAAGKNNDGFADTVALARYTATGALDTGFDTDGIVLTPFGNTSSNAARLLIRPNGTLIATGSASAIDMKPISGYAVAQYNTNGSLDTSFSGDGKLIAFNLHSDASLSEVALQPDGKIVAAGTASNDIALARYNSDGSLDPTFGTGGIVTTTGSLVTTSISALGLTLQSDGKIVTIGTAVDGGSPSVLLARYNTNGTLDTTFGDGGFASINMQAQYTSVMNVTQQADGKLVALFGSSVYAVIVRYLPNGTLDATFGNGGIVEDNFGGNSSSHDLAIQSDGKILITGAGASQNPPGQDLMVARYLTNGAPDPSFGTNGRVLIDFGSSYEEAYSMAIQPDGKILAGGYSDLPSVGSVWAMARVEANGAPDTTFGVDGKKTVDFADSSNDELHTLKLLPDGRIVGGGNESARIARFNSDGSIDPSFGTGGFVQNSAFYISQSIAIQSDNKIVVGGDTYAIYTDRPFKVARFLNSLTTVTPTVIPSATATTCAVGWNYVPWVGETGMRTINGVKAWAADNVWAAGTSNTDTQVLHWDGAQWSIIPSPDVPDKLDTLEFIDGSSPSDMWAVGNSFDSFTGQTDPLAIHWDGTQWSMSTLPAVNFADLTSVKSISANDAWAVGYSGGTPYRTFVLHWDGSIWSIVTTPTPPGNTGSSFSGVSAYSSSDVWAVGYSMLSGLSVTLTEHWNGSAWSIVDGANVASRNNNLTGVTMVGPNDAWAVGDSAALQVKEGLVPPTESLLIHWDGTSWTRVSSPNPASIVFMTGISAVSSDDVWAVGFTYENGIGNTVTLRWNGSIWQDVVSPNPSALADNLWAVSAISSDDVWAVGEFGAQSGGSQLLALQYQTCVTPSPSATAPTATMTSTSTPTSNSTNTQTVTGTPPTSVSTTTPTGTTTAVISVTSTITALTSTPVNTATACAISFEDVPVGSTFYPYIECMACRGIINGYPCGGVGEPCNGNDDPYFRPGNNVTRGQFAKITSNAAGFNETPGAQQYEDVVPGSTFYDFIWRLSDRGYINGYPCGGAGEPCGPNNLPYFRPNANVTRGQIAKIDSNAAGFIDPPGAQQYEDVLQGSTFYAFIWRLSARGLVNGYPCGGASEPCGPSNLPYFRPSANATRGQASKIVSNTFFPACNVSIR